MPAVLLSDQKGRACTARPQRASPSTGDSAVTLRKVGFDSSFEWATIHSPALHQSPAKPATPHGGLSHRTRADSR
jgi:hypothetical protein